MCDLGARQSLGATPLAALSDAIAALQWTAPEGPVPRDEAIRRILESSCQAHRIEAEALLRAHPLTPAATGPRSSGEKRPIPEVVKETARKPARGRTVLVVEDDVTLRRDVCEALELAGYDAVGAANGGDAMRYLRAGRARPALILLDLSMPDVDGFELRAWLRTDRALAAIPVVAISGHAGLLERARSLGIAVSLLKPFSPDALVECVRTFAG